jgi:hypothetical protein
VQLWHKLGNNTEAILRLIGTAIGAGFEIKSIVKAGSGALKAIASKYGDDVAEAISKYGDDFVEMAKPSVILTLQAMLVKNLATGLNSVLRKQESSL